MMTHVDPTLACGNLEASTRRNIDTGSQFVRQITRLEVVSVTLVACTALLFVLGSSSGTTQLSKSKPYFNLNQSKRGEFKFKYTTGRRHDAQVNQLMATECNRKCQPSPGYNPLEDVVISCIKFCSGLYDSELQTIHATKGNRASARRQAAEIKEPENTQETYSEQEIARKSICCNYIICGNMSSTEKQCSDFNGTDVGDIKTGKGTDCKTVLGGQTVKRCLCIWQNYTEAELAQNEKGTGKTSANQKNERTGFCYGWSTEHIINDTDTTNFPQACTPLYTINRKSNRTYMYNNYITNMPMHRNLHQSD
jgi:hypothetical protein